ncbi:MAG: hypothetical protein U1E27_00330 [Kiritimatiellia bacterium]|nr:hypothetical protein [Kiritimatiellia bacterium]
MKTCLILLIGARILAPVLCGAQSYVDAAWENATPPAEPIRVSLRLGAENLSHTHDALQHRADYTDQTRQHWQNGAKDGDGLRLSLHLRQGADELEVSIRRLNYEFDRSYNAANRHQVDTKRTDWDVLYRHAKEGRDAPGERNVWGWAAGIRYMGTEKRVQLQESASRKDVRGDIHWKLLQGGYWGSWRPAAWNVQLFGALNFLLGEVDGMTRHGNDRGLDGRIKEAHRNDQGLAYGMNMSFGVGADFLRYAHARVGYRREWLYSFQATDSGIVVFPDNDDALFIENIGGLYAELGVHYEF